MGQFDLIPCDKIEVCLYTLLSDIHLQSFMIPTDILQLII